MRRLSLQLFALLLALGAVRLITSPDTFALHLLRDGLLVMLLAALLFAWQGGGWRPVNVPHSVMRLSSAGHTLWLTGIVCLVAGGIGVGFDVGGLAHLVASLVWTLGIVLSVAGVWWPGATLDYAPPAFRWETDARGRFVRKAQAAVALDLPSPSRVVWGWALAAIVLGILLRFWNLGGLPAGCVGAECIDGLRLVDGEMLTFSHPGAFNLAEWLARLLFGVTGDGILSLRLTGAILGSVTVLLFAAVAKRLTPPLFLAPAVLLLAVNPWHLWASRVADGGLVPALLVTLALWLTLEALAHADLRWWTLAGLALGLLVAEAPALRGGVFLWMVVIGLAGLAGGGVWRRRLTAIAAAAGAALGMAAPALVYSALAGAPFAAHELQAAHVPILIAALFRPDVTPDGGIAAGGLLSAVTVALATLGIALLVRHLNRAAALVIAAGVCLLGAAVLTVDLALTAPRSLLLALLPLLLAAAVLTIDRVLSALVVAWGALVRPARLVAGASLLLLVILGASVMRFAEVLHAFQGAGAGSLPNEMARFVADQAAANTEQSFVVPANVMNHPGMRLLAGAAIAAGRVELLDFGTTMPYGATPRGDVLYLVPAAQSQVLDQLLQLYPDATLADNASGAAWTLEGQQAHFSVLTVPREMILESQALRLRADRSRDPGAADVVELDTIAPGLPLKWQSHPPLPPPFVAELTSSLSIPVAGAYTFAAADVTSPLLFILDGLLVLDTALGVTEQTLNLPQGIHPLAITYRSGDQPTDLSLLWQPPGAPALTPLPTTALHLPVLAGAGLQGDYFAGSEPGGMLLTQRKDRVIGFDFGLAPPYNVRWQGQLGITRAGEYLIATLADGPNQLRVDGVLVVDGSQKLPATPEAATEEAYNEGLIYLAPGWRTIEILYSPRSEAPEFRLLWQPPGANPGELTSAYLRPGVGETLTAAPLPPAPPLLDPSLGNDTFALTRAVSAWQPDVRIPPDNLEPLPLETLWTAGAGCGAGENQLSAPHGLAFDPELGQLYVADTGNRRIQMLDLDGGFVRQITAADFQEPVDVAFGADGALRVLDAVAGPIYRIGADDTVALQPVQTTFYRPRGFDVGDDGAIAVADTGGGRVVTLAADGALQGQYGGVDTLLARGQPVDALFGAAGVWAISAEDGRLWNLAVDGGLTAVQPTNTIEGPQLAALPTGGLLVSDPLRRTFTALAPGGQPLQQFAYREQLVLPTGIATLTLGNQLFIAVSDTRACTVSLWRMAVDQLR